MQQVLFHESLNDALREVVQTLGGTKKVGVLMRPEKSADEAARWISDCLNPDRREKFDPEQVLWLLREGRRVELAERALREERDKVRFLTELLQGKAAA